MNKLITTMGLLCSTAFVATIPLTVNSCGSQNHDSYNGLKVGDYIQIYLIGSISDYTVGTITEIGSGGIMLDNHVFFPGTSIKEVIKNQP